MRQSSYRYDKFLYQIHQAILSFIEEDKIRGEEYRRLILIDEFIKIVMQSNTINYDAVNMFMQISMRNKK